MKNKSIAGAFTAMATFLWCSSCSSSNDASSQASNDKAGNVILTAAQRQNIKLYTVSTSKFHKSIEANGAVDFDNDQATSVLAPFSGPVSRLLVSLGDQVKKGDSLAVVDSPDFAAAIGTYRKTLAIAGTNRHLADLDKDLLQHQGVSQREAAQAETDAIGAEADRDAADQALVSLGVNPRTIHDIQEGRAISSPGGLIRSPVAGTVVEKLITPGELLEAGTTPCFTVANLSRVWVIAQVFGADVTSVGVGDTAEVQNGIDSKNISGRVDNISALVDSNTRSVAVRVVADNPGNFLKKQMYVHVLIQSRQEITGLLVPVSAILHDDENLPFVFKAQSDSSFARQTVTVGYRTGDQYNIAAGLNAGDKIVVDGGIFVQFMQTQ
jgi:membrane fusion protein, heavy metal efflux system